MNLRQFWAVLYVLILDDLRREFDAAQLSASVARAMGSDVDFPSWRDTREEFDEYLASEPDLADGQRQVHLVALGLR